MHVNFNNLKQIKNSKFKIFKFNMKIHINMYLFINKAIKKHQCTKGRGLPGTGGSLDPPLCHMDQWPRDITPGMSK